MVKRWLNEKGKCLLCGEIEMMYYKKAANGAHIVKCRECQSQWEGLSRSAVEFAANIEA